ncbi:MAG: nucleotidyltransferase domain-containing protein [Fimbriimonadales bacterium]|nr:MAG: nucleotidyltransferase [Fimbriimonadales bacterium]
MQTQPMTDEATRLLITEAIRSETAASGVAVEQIVLFGSRARGDADTQSDWDLLIILQDPLSRQKRIELFARLNRTLARLLIPCDLIIRSQQEVQREAQQVGAVVRRALMEGLPL